MANNSKIQWTDATWNIAVGCTKVDEDCKFCYMYRDSMKETRYNPRTVRKTTSVFNAPLRWKEPKKVFTSSLTDFFHEDCDSFRDEAWEVIRKCPQHIFQILTKRPERITLPEFWTEIRDRVWLGTSVGSEKGLKRVIDLINSKADCLLFLSLEPLHESLDLSHLLHLPQCPKRSMFARMDCDCQEYIKKRIDWVIVGGESGNDTGLYRYRPCKLEWIESIVNQCKDAGIPVFVKQLGTHLSKEMGLKDKHGGDIDEFHEHLKTREFPFGF